MNPADFVYDQIYKGALKLKVNEFVARDHAVMGMDMYKKGKFKKVNLLIKDQIAAAKKLSKGVN